MAGKKEPLLGLEISVRVKAPQMLHDMATLVLAKIRENISLTDHTLDALRDLKHPYSVKKYYALHTPDYQVHIDTGDLFNAVGINIINQYRIQVGVDEDEAPHIRHIFYGTRKMVARDFISGSINEVRDALQRRSRKWIHDIVVFDARPQ